MVKYWNKIFAKLSDNGGSTVIPYAIAVVFM